jgi:hypothetical protein
MRRVIPALAVPLPGAVGILLTALVARRLGPAADPIRPVGRRMP